MKKISITFLAVSLMAMYACGGSSSDTGSDGSTPTSMVDDEPVNDGKGVGEIKNVTLNDPLNDGMVGKGQAIYEMKCAACHKLTDQRTVGPGWKGLTSKRKPEWLMNMITNVEIMLEKDPEAQKLLEECLVRMPNQNLSIGDARDVLEFMYDNDKE